MSGNNQGQKVVLPISGLVPVDIGDGHIVYLTPGESVAVCFNTGKIAGSGSGTAPITKQILVVP